MDDPIRVLQVGGDPESVEATSTRLERADERFVVETATSASEGSDRLAEGAFDCVVSGHDPPEMDGVAFLETVREEHPDLPFVLLPDEGSEAVASRAISAGVTDYLRMASEGDQHEVLANRIELAVEQYRSRQAAEETRRKLERLTERTDDVLFMFDGDWSELHFVNSAYEDVWGAPTAELREDPASFLEYVHPEDREEVRRAMERLSGGEPGAMEYRVLPPEGEQRWVRADSKPICEGESVERIVGFVRDVTDRKAYERELERQNERLEEFVAVVSHELRNPLNIAAGKVDLARKKRDSDHLDHAASALDRIGTLIEDLLALAREGKAVDDPEPIDLADVTEACWRNVETAAATLTNEADGRIRADPSRLKQLFENLFRNAVEHSSTSPPASRKDHSSTSPRSQAPEDAVERGVEAVTITVGTLPDGFYVADDGPGIVPDEREKVFEAGYSTAADGTGFGLSIVAGIVEAHGWEIDLIESDGGGARFEITGVETVE